MVRQSGNTLINNKSWAQIVMNSGTQNKLQQNKAQNKKAQTKPQKKQQIQAQKANTQQLKQVKQYLDKSKSSVKQIKKFVSTTQYPRSISSAQLKALQQEFQGLCNLFNASSYFGKSVYSQKKAWIQARGRSVISVASCYSLRHKPVQNVIRPQQKRAMTGGLKFIPKQNKNKNAKKNQRFGESKQTNWGSEKAWGKNQPKQIREPPKDQIKKQKQQQKQLQQKQQQQQQQQQLQQMEKIQQRHKKQMELLQRAQLKQQELLLKKQTEQRKKLLQYQKQQKLRLQQQSGKPVSARQAPAPVKAAPVRAVRMVNQKPLIRQAKPLRHRLDAVRKQNQMVGRDTFTYTLNQLCDAFNYFSKKSYSGDRAWKYNKFLGGYFSTASYFAERNAPFVPSSRPRVNVTNGLPVYTFNVKPISKNVIKPYNSNLQGVRTEGNGKYFEHWHMGSIWTHYYSKPKARRV